MDRPDRLDGPEVDPAHLHLQPAEDYAGEDGELIAGWMSDPEHSKERERLERLEADEELLLALQLNGFGGKPWDTFCQEVARYGVGVMSSWIGRGLVYGRVKTL